MPGAAVVAEAYLWSVFYTVPHIDNVRSVPMRSIGIVAAGLLLLGAIRAAAIDLPKVPELGGLTKGSLLGKVNKSLADQQNRDGQFEFKSGQAQFASGNAKRISGLLKVLNTYSGSLSAIPDLHVTAEGHTDGSGAAQANEKLSIARATTVCEALKKQGMKLPCKPTGFGSSRPLVTPEKTAADKQRNRRVLVQISR